MSAAHLSSRLESSQPGGPGRGRGDDYFADEVAIDFPSVAGVVERMYDAFRGADDDVEPHQASLSVSPREAVDGLVAPLQVPIRHVCLACGGRGETWAESCEGCRGTGAALGHCHVHVMLPAGLRDGARFHFRLFTPLARPTRVELTVAIR